MRKIEQIVMVGDRYWRERGFPF